MKDILEVAALSGLLAALLIRTFQKYGLSKRYDYYKTKRMPLYCQLCVATWKTLAIVFILLWTKQHNLDILQCVLAGLAASPIALTLSNSNEDI